MSRFSFGTRKSLGLLSNFVPFCCFIVSHPLHLFKIFYFLSHLFFTATLWLLAFLTLKHGGESFPESVIGFLLTIYQTLVESLRYKVEEYDESHGGCKSFLETIGSPEAVLEMKSRGNCFEAVEDMAENGKPEEIARRNGETVGSDVWKFGSTRKRKEWTRTLACKLFQERHSNNVDGGCGGGGDGEGMDLLWEVLETDSAYQAVVMEGGGNNNNSGYYYYYGDEPELNGQFCCFQPLKLNLGRGRPKPNLGKKISKGLGWLHYLWSSLGKKRY